MFPPEIQKIISTYQIFGFIPLDKVLHVLVGMIITIVLRTFKLRMGLVFTIVFLLAVAKEINDTFVLNNTMEEHILDILVSIAYPLILWVAIIFKERTQD
jgi:hypothetical protein